MKIKDKFVKNVTIHVKVAQEINQLNALLARKIIPI